MQSFRFALFTVCEIQGSKLKKKKKKKKKKNNNNNNNKQKKKKNWENEHFAIFPMFVMQILPYFRYIHMYVAHSYNSAVSELILQRTFQMYGHDAVRPRPSLYTKYYCTL